MSIAITEEHAALAAAARRFLDNHCPPAVARAALEAEVGSLPPFWDEMAKLGWLGLHIDEADGGQGFGLAELAVVVEELGRVGAPGPFVPTALAIAAIARGGTTVLRQSALPGLIAGTTVGAVALATSRPLDATAPDDGGTITLSGTARPILGAAMADWVIVAAGGPGDERWCVVPAGDLTVAPVPSLDPTRPCGTVTASGARVPASHQLALPPRAVEDLGAALLAAECAGGAGWCLETAAAYATVREQFGRPIGQFQAVKHRCADMLVAVEEARAVAWDAASAVDQSRDTGRYDEAALAAAVAGAVAPDAFFQVAKDCIQVLGGIGFTWEHDAHRYLRRATTVRQLLGGPAPWRERVAGLALSGVRRRLGVDLPAETEALRSEVGATADAIAACPAAQRRTALVDAGLFVPHWPRPWGRAAGAVEQLIIDQELRRAKLRRAHLAVGAWAAPTIATHGTAAQQERWVRPTLLGTIQWCQLFSEPGAGSDLAALATKAVAASGGWLLSGQKVWTSLAAEADWGICLARTDSSVAKHQGITYFVVDMRSAGIEIRPLREMTGNTMFNEVYLSDVFVPDDCVIGPVHGGWALARTTLANERVAMGSGSSFGGGLEALLALARELERGALDRGVPGPGELGPDGLGPVARDGLGALVAEAQTVTLLGLRSTHRAVAGAGPGPEASVRKLLAAEHDQRTQEYGLALLAGEGATTEGAAGQWSFGFLANRCLTIAGGTSEVQRNVIAERLLGLPRDVEPGA